MWRAFSMVAAASARVRSVLAVKWHQQATSRGMGSMRAGVYVLHYTA